MNKLFNIIKYITILAIGIAVGINLIIQNPNLLSSNFWQTLGTLDLGTLPAWGTLVIAILGFLISRSSLEISKKSNQLNIEKISRELAKDVSTYVPPLKINPNHFESSVQNPSNATKLFNDREFMDWISKKEYYKFSEIKDLEISVKTDFRLDVPKNFQVIIRSVEINLNSEICFFDSKRKPLEDYINKPLPHGIYKLSWIISQSGQKWIELDSLLEIGGGREKLLKNYFGFDNTGYMRRNQQHLANCKKPTLKIKYTTSYNPEIIHVWKIEITDSILVANIADDSSHKIYIKKNNDSIYPMIYNHSIDGSSILGVIGIDKKF